MNDMLGQLNAVHRQTATDASAGATDTEVATAVDNTTNFYAPTLPPEPTRSEDPSN
jgi:hypothetical protein